MTTSYLQILTDWLALFPGGTGEWLIDYVDHVPIANGVYPGGLAEVSRDYDIMGNCWVTTTANFAVYKMMDYSDPTGSEQNAEWVERLQKWTQAQSVTGKAPRFGTDETYLESITAGNGSLFEASTDGWAVYSIQLTVTFRNYYDASEV